MPLVLHGYRYSVYVRIVRLVLAEKGVAYDRVEVNPFAPDRPASYLALHPFGRVPVMVHDGFSLYETGAITRYLDRAFPVPSLQPEPMMIGFTAAHVAVGSMAFGAAIVLALSVSRRPHTHNVSGGMAVA